VDVPPVRTDRLELVSLGPDAMEALLTGAREAAGAVIGATIPDGWPDEHDASFLRLRLGQVRAESNLQEWAVRALVLADERVVAGHIGFHGPPGINALRRKDAVEIGYTVFPEYRRRGLAVEAAGGIVDWASRTHGIRVFVASISPENEASLGVVRRLGFVHVGEHWDEQDGLEHEYMLELPLAA
jgi:RimJ/RimL family protein N-acetyltransferase